MTKTMIEGTEVRVGDWIGFKSDIEQSGRIVEITQRDRWSEVELVLENANGFRGEYIGGQKRTTVFASDCWA